MTPIINTTFGPISTVAQQNYCPPSLIEWTMRNAQAETWRYFHWFLLFVIGLQLISLFMWAMSAKWNPAVSDWFFFGARALLMFFFILVIGVTLSLYFAAPPPFQTLNLSVVLS